MRSDQDKLWDILEAIERIEGRADIERNAFDSDELVQTWMVHNLQIIGEAVAATSPEFRECHPGIPWRAIASMRNTIVHAYFRVDLDEVWSAIKNDIPALKIAIKAIIESCKD